MINQSTAIVLAVTAITSVAIAAERIPPDPPLPSNPDPQPEVIQDSTTSWRNDPAWYEGKAEWALYDAVRPIYGVARHYEATIFTNKQHMDPATTTKAEDWRTPGMIKVFKHNVSEIIPTENYTYRFLTTSFVRSDTLAPYKLAVSTQEDCGATYKQFVVRDDRVHTHQFCYFPGADPMPLAYNVPPEFAMQDMLSLVLRDYPFGEADHPVWTKQLIADQTDTHETSLSPRQATVAYVTRETVSVPYGAIDCHHLRVTHRPSGAVTQSDYWFAADSDLRHVMVKYAGPYGVTYELKKLAWWAYWSDPRPE